MREHARQDEGAACRGGERDEGSTVHGVHGMWCEAARKEEVGLGVSAFDIGEVKLLDSWSLA